jgi:hypothetical protein
MSCLITLTVLAATVGQLPEEAVNELDYYVGDWNFEWEVDDVTYRGTWSAKWAPDKSCLVSHWTSVSPIGKASGRKITGWDASKKQTVDLDCSSRGEIMVSRHSKVKDNLWIGEGTGSNEDGESVSCKFETKTEPNRFTWTQTDRIEGGESQPDLVFVFRRMTPQ